MIAQVAQRDQEAAADALERLVRRYWSAVYAYVRRSGRDVHEAADLTQGFVCDIIISRRPTTPIRSGADSGPCCSRPSRTIFASSTASDDAPAASTGCRASL